MNDIYIIRRYTYIYVHIYIYTYAFMCKYTCVYIPI